MSRRRDDDVINRSKYVTIGELARITSVRYSTLKYYTEESLLEFQQEDENLTRRYDRVASIERLNLIKQFRTQGKSISEIKKILEV